MPEMMPTRTFAEIKEKIKALVKARWEECEKSRWESFYANEGWSKFTDYIYWWYGFEDESDCGENGTKHMERYFELDNFIKNAVKESVAPYFEILRQRSEKKYDD